MPQKIFTKNYYLYIATKYTKQLFTKITICITSKYVKKPFAKNYCFYIATNTSNNHLPKITMYSDMGNFIFQPEIRNIRSAERLNWKKKQTFASV